MNQTTRLCVGAFLVAFTCFGTAGIALAQDKSKDAKAAPTRKAVQKPLFENEKVRVFEISFKPGDEGAINATRPFRVTRALKGGTLLRTYADGSTEKIEWKTGEVMAAEADSKPYTLKNVGKSEVMLYNVYLKESKK